MPELTKLTPVADAEYLFHEKSLTIDLIPVTPEGYDAKTSSASPNNLQSRKERVIGEAFERAGIEKGQLKDNPLEALRQFGDPMMATVVAFPLASGRTSS